MNKHELIKALQPNRKMSAWRKGVIEYAVEILEDLEVDELPDDIAAVKKLLLNGAEDWKQYRYSGCSLVYDGDIAERLCSPSELKRCKNGTKPPRQGVEWLDVQTRALKSAWMQIRETMLNRRAICLN